ncbi:thiamine pyrophosphate-dependent enzyme [Ktedonobacter sp. SOSP1-52]|uniref:thiamine pyrophosphate-dependent enzyme n=1 Tax=Ktedonobacter sp. SOSP1-52 TaxID=2778366 RepID=UPI001916526E|nr:thiamine pyrophosphate-dependent enzyme [Ktedonobacter sp. SOSP1-52]
MRATGRTFLRAAGTLGWAFPSVLGAQLALTTTPERRAIALIGDGGFGYHIGDLETAVRLKLPAICIVLNNASLAYEAIAFKYQFDGDVVGEVCDFIDTDYSQITRDFGCFGARVDTIEGFRQALDEALSRRKPAVLDVVVSNNRFAPVTTFDHWVKRDL